MQSKAEINESLNKAEIENRCEDLRSFPTFVGLNMTSICNAHCTFCSKMTNQPHKDFMTLEDVKKMTWLEHVKDLAVWCGIGDSLVNPEFLDCYRYLNATFSNLKINLSSNGIGLTEEICKELLSLDYFNVSLNATTGKEWSEIMRVQGNKFDHICRMYKYISNLKKERGKGPVLKLSMVVTKDNVQTAVKFAELAHELGAEQITYVHFVTSTLVGKRDLNIEQSLYYDQASSDYYISEAELKAKQLGLVVTKPLPFFTIDCHFDHGMRAVHKETPCHDPWKTCYLTVDEDGNRQMIFCCSGFYYEIGYDKSDLTEENFRKLWNHPTARYFRKTVNQDGENAICNFCHTHDHFDPDDKTIYDIGPKIKPVFSDIDAGYKSAACQT